MGGKRLQAGIRLLKSFLDALEEFLRKRINEWNNHFVRLPASLHDSAASALDISRIPQKQFIGAGKLSEGLRSLKPNEIEQVQRQKHSKQAWSSSLLEEASKSNFELRSGEFRIWTHNIE